MRYEIKDIWLNEEIWWAMALVAEYEWLKRSIILKSEGEKQSIIN